MENHMKIDHDSEGSKKRSKGSQTTKTTKQQKQQSTPVQNNMKIDKEVDIKTFFPSNMHPISILDDIGCRLQVQAPKYEFNKVEKSDKITCTIKFLDKSWSTCSSCTMQGSKEDVAILAFEDIMENMEQNLRIELVKSLKNCNKRLPDRFQREIPKVEDPRMNQKVQKRKLKKFIGKKPKVLNWLNQQISKGRQDLNKNFKCPCRMLKEFCKYQNLDEPIYDITEIYNSFVGGVTIGDFHQNADCVEYHEICIKERSSELAFNHLFNQLYEKEYLELNSERKEIYKPWDALFSDNLENGEETVNKVIDGDDDDDDTIISTNSPPVTNNDKYDEGSETSDDIEYEEEMTIDKGKGKDKEMDKGEEMDDQEEMSEEEEELGNERGVNVINYIRCPYEEPIYPQWQPQYPYMYDTRPFKSYSSLLSEMIDARRWKGFEYIYEKIGEGWYCTVRVKDQSFKSDYCLKSSEAKNSASKKAYLTFCNA